MSRHIRKERCATCGEPHWFRYWVGDFCAKSSEGLYVCDFDLALHRFKTCIDGLGSRDIEHMMIAEIKTQDEKLGRAQRDTLSVMNGAISSMMAVNGTPIDVQSRPGMIDPRERKIVWHGIHLVRVPARPSNIGPFFWDNHPICSKTLAEVMSFVRDPAKPALRLDIDRRHKAKRSEAVSLFSMAH